jgi:hypothetical protein
MGKRGEGYGSEDHLRKYLASADAVLNRAVAESLGTSPASITWLDFPRAPSGTEREYRGLEFLTLPEHREVRDEWRRFWPTSGRQPTWDAVGKADGEWLLVEAKANVPEFTGAPSTASPDNLKQIQKALGKVKGDLGVHRHFSWVGSYYQYANRLAVLWFLRKHRVPAHLVFIYFTGDLFPDKRRSPRTRADWDTMIEARRLTLGLPRRHRLSKFDHHVVLPALRGRR